MGKQTPNFNSTYLTGDICVKAISSCAQSATLCRQVIYYSAKPFAPGIITGKSIGVCTSENYEVQPVENATGYNWVAPNNTTIVSGQGTRQIVLSFGAGFVSGNLIVTATNCKGAGTARVLNLSRNPAQPSSITGPTSAVCSGATKTYSTPLVTGATLYQWTVPSGAVIKSGQGSNKISVTFPPGFISGKISVAAGTSCGYSAFRNITVISKPDFPAPIDGPATVCTSTVGLQYSTTAVTGVTYHWLVPAGATITSGQGTASITVNWGTVSGQVKVSGSNACGASSYRSLSVILQGCSPPFVSMAKSEYLQVDEALRVEVWPNPASNVLLVTLQAFEPNQKMELSLLQADGKVQQAQSLVPSIRGQQVRMDVSQAAAGYYILVAKQQGTITNKRVVVVR